MPLAPGARLGPYEIIAPLGAGGMGEVYRGRDTRLQREVAIKVLPASLAHDERALQRLEQEARAVAALNHPNLLSIHDIGKTPAGAPYLVTELLEGEPLRQLLHAGTLGQAKAVDYAAQMARGLAAAHEKGIVHRDLKPENVFVTADGRVKILDFGLAKLTSAGSEDVTLAEPAAAATAPGAVLGTVGYMSPEQVRGQPADARSDIFSLGAVLYEMLTGRRAFRGDSAVEVMSAILKEDPEPLSPPSTSTASGTAAHALSPALDRIVRHCLEKQPRQRFQSADDIAFQLGDVTQPSTTTINALPAVRRPRAVPILSAALVLAVAATAWLALRPTAQPALAVLQRITYQRGTVEGARFTDAGRNLVISADWNDAPAISVYSGAIPASASLPALQAMASAQGVVVAASSAGDIALLGADPQFGMASLLSVISAGGSAPRPTLPDATGAAFAPGSSRLAVARRAPQGVSTLEYPVGHVLYRTGGFCTDLHFSPDGRSIAFLDHPSLQDDRGAVALVDLQGHERRLTHDFFTAKGLAWADKGQQIWFTASDTEDRSLYAVTLKGRLRQVWQAPSRLTLEAVAPDGRVLLTSDDLRSSVRVITPHDPAGEEITIHDYSIFATVAADGSEVLVDDEVGGEQNDYTTWLHTLGSNALPVRLGKGLPAALSPDGHWALTSLIDADHQLMLLPTGPGEPRPLTPVKLQLRGLDLAAFTPSGAVVAIARRSANHPYRTYLIQRNGNVRPVTPPGIVGMWPTSDGKYVLAELLSSHAWALYPLAGGAPTPEPAMPAGYLPLGFQSNDNQLLIRPAAASGTSQGIFSLNLRTGQRTPVMTVRPPVTAGLTLFRITSASRDGKTVAYYYQTVLSTLYVIKGLH